jgi:hypothetical protein
MMNKVMYMLVNQGLGQNAQVVGKAIRKNLEALGYGE